jgi:aromatic-L-amino-acid decarboxylase
MRWRPAFIAGRPEDRELRGRLDACNQEILDRVNRSGRIYLSHTRLRERFAIRVSLGNLRAGIEHVERCWGLLREAAGGLDTALRGL